MRVQYEWREYVIKSLMLMRHNSNEIAICDCVHCIELNTLNWLKFYFKNFPNNFFFFSLSKLSNFWLVIWKRTGNQTPNAHTLSLPVSKMYFHSGIKIKRRTNKFSTLIQVAKNKRISITIIWRHTKTQEKNNQREGKIKKETVLPNK